MERGRIEAGRDAEVEAVTEDQLEGRRGAARSCRRRSPGGRDGHGPAGRRAGRWPAAVGGGEVRRVRVSAEEGGRGGGGRARCGRSGGRCGGRSRTGRGSSPSGGSRRGRPTSRSRGTTEPWRGLRGPSRRAHLARASSRFVDGVHRTLTLDRASRFSMFLVPGGKLPVGIEFGHSGIRLGLPRDPASYL